MPSSVVGDKPEHERERLVLTLASERVVFLEVPKERLARIAYSSRHPFLAGAESPLRDVLASAQGEEVGRDSFGVAIALFAQRIVVPLRSTGVALLAHKVVVAEASARVVAGHAARSERITVTCWRKAKRKAHQDFFSGKRRTI